MIRIKVEYIDSQEILAEEDACQSHKREKDGYSYDTADDEA